MCQCVSFGAWEYMSRFYLTVFRYTVAAVVLSLKFRMRLATSSEAARSIVKPCPLRVQPQAVPLPANRTPVSEQRRQISVMRTRIIF